MLCRPQAIADGTSSASDTSTCSSASETSDNESEVESLDEYQSVEGSISSSDTEEIHFLAKDGSIRWTSTEPQQRGRRNAANIVPQAGGPAPHVRPRSLSESFDFFFTQEMLDIVVENTNIEAEAQIENDGVAQELAQRWYPICRMELRAFFGILFLQGVLRGGNQRLRDFWDNRFGQPAIIATMSYHRFMDILKFLRFDNKRTRAARRTTDRLAAIRHLWELFLHNCRRCLIASPFVTVDEQLLPTRGRQVRHENLDVSRRGVRLFFGR